MAANSTKHMATRNFGAAPAAPAARVARTARTAALALVALMLALAAAVLSPAVAPQKANQAFAATTIQEVELTVKFDDIPCNASVTGREVQAAFDVPGARAISKATQQYCYMDKNYCRIVEKLGTFSSGAIRYNILKSSNELLTSGKEYYLVFNLIQNSGYTFPGDYNATRADCPLRVKVNGVVRSDVLVNWYNNDSVDIFVPLPFDNKTIVTDISFDPAKIYLQRGTSRTLHPVIKGTPGAQLNWSLSGASMSQTHVSNGGWLYVSADEPVGRVLTVTATSKDFPTIKGVCKVEVIADPPSITSIKMKPSASKADVRNGSDTLHVNVIVEGTMDPDFTVALEGAQSMYTKIDSQDRSGFDLYVSSDETSAELKLTVTSKLDPSKKAVLNVPVILKPFVKSIDLKVNTEVLNRNCGLTAGEFKKLINFDNVWVTSEGTFVDYRYVGLYTRKFNGSDRYIYTSVDNGTVIDPNGVYFLRINVEEQKGWWWPSDVEDVDVTANGKWIGLAYGNGEQRWYSHTPDGSLDVFVPVGNKATFVKPEWDFSVAKRIAAVNYNGSITKAAYPVKCIKSADGTEVLSISSTGEQILGPAAKDMGNIALGDITFSKKWGSEYLSVTTKGTTAGVKTGKITVAPKTPVGEYQIAVRITIPGDAHHAATNKDVLCTVQVKRFTPTITVTSKVSPNKNYSKTKDQQVTMIKAVQCAAKPLSYSIVKIMGPDNKKVSDAIAAKFSVDPLTGVVTFKKGTPRGTYKVMFKISSPAVAGYNANWRTATGVFKIV